MSQIADVRNPWRDILLSEPASFRGIMFHVESGSRSSGRRVVVHEYPKRSDEMGPWAEDMGKHAIRFQFTGYLVYRPSNPRYVYTQQRKLLYDALEKPEGGKLVHPVFYPGGILAMVERYSMTESRERGGYTAFEMQFVQAGAPPTSLNQQSQVDTAGTVKNTAAAAEQAAVATNQQITQIIRSA